MCVLLLGGEIIGGRRDPNGETFTHEPTGLAYAVRKGEGIVRAKNLQMVAHSY